MGYEEIPAIRAKYNDPEGGTRCKGDWPLLWHFSSAAISSCEHCGCGARFIYGIPGVPDEICTREAHIDGLHENETATWTVAVQVSDRPGRIRCKYCDELMDADAQRCGQGHWRPTSEIEGRCNTCCWWQGEECGELGAIQTQSWHTCGDWKGKEESNES